MKHVIQDYVVFSVNENAILLATTSKEVTLEVGFVLGDALYGRNYWKLREEILQKQTSYSM